MMTIQKMRRAMRDLRRIMEERRRTEAAGEERAHYWAGFFDALGILEQCAGPEPEKEAQDERL